MLNRELLDQQKTSQKNLKIALQLSQPNSTPFETLL